MNKIISESKTIKPHQQLSFRIGVGGKHYVPTAWEEMTWKCPTIIIDYVRVFENIDALDHAAHNLNRCSDLRTKGKSYPIEEICANAVASLPKSQQFNYGNFY